MGKVFKIVIYTDGACSGNPGPMGIGAVLLCPPFKKIKKICQPIGHGTNNIAELQAISLALSALNSHQRKDCEVTIRSDSQYAIGMLSKGWKIKANVTLVLAVLELMTQFNSVTFEKVKAHNGDKYNEWADKLAQIAVEKNKEMAT